MLSKAGAVNPIESWCSSRSQRRCAGHSTVVLPTGDAGTAGDRSQGLPIGRLQVGIELHVVGGVWRGFPSQRYGMLRRVGIKIDDLERW